MNQLQLISSIKFFQIEQRLQVDGINSIRMEVDLLQQKQEPQPKDLQEKEKRSILVISGLSGILLKLQLLFGLEIMMDQKPISMEMVSKQQLQ